MSAVDSLRAAVERVIAEKATPDSTKVELEKINSELQEIADKLNATFPVETSSEESVSSMAAVDEVPEAKIPS